MRALMAALAFVLLASACSSTVPHGALGEQGRLSADSTLLLHDVATLSADAMEGRGTGTPGNDRAAAWIARRFEQLGLVALVRGGDAATCAADSSNDVCVPGFLQPFNARSVMTTRAGDQPPGTNNVVALVRGQDPSLRGQYVVVGAHFDHLGRMPQSAMDPEKGNAIRNGADDNASGTAMVLELARLFKRTPAKRSIVFVAFSGEELGLLGSQWFVEHAPVALDSVQAMLNFDMVGRLRDDRLTVYGVATATELPALVDSVNAARPLALVAQGDGFGASDHSSFYAKGIPVLHFFTGIHGEYHRASDQVALINAGGMAKVAAFAEGVTRALADRPARLTAVRAVASAPARGSREGTGVYLGSIPDMSAVDVTGVRLMGVRAGSPADKSGMKEGDVIVEFDGHPVKDLQSYSEALFTRKPGDVVKVVVVRAGARVALDVTLGKRGG